MSNPNPRLPNIMIFWVYSHPILARMTEITTRSNKQKFKSLQEYHFDLEILYNEMTFNEAS